MIILDSDHLTLLERENPFVSQILANNLAKVPVFEVCTTIISFEEKMRGWLAVLANVKIWAKRFRRTASFKVS